MKRHAIGYIGSIWLLLWLVGCQENKHRAVEKIVTEWMGKEIVFPEEATAWYMGKDTALAVKNKAPFRVLVYTDSVGCTSCKLNLTLWKYYIAEMDSIAPGQVNFSFYFQPKNKKELAHLLRRDRFEQVVFLDERGMLKKQNRLAAEMEYQCFLLDQQNKVVAIGNPTLNPKLWDIYKGAVVEYKE